MCALVLLLIFFFGFTRSRLAAGQRATPPRAASRSGLALSPRAAGDTFTFAVRVNVGTVPAGPLPIELLHRSLVWARPDARRTAFGSRCQTATTITAAIATTTKTTDRRQRITRVAYRCCYRWWGQDVEGGQCAAVVVGGISLRGAGQPDKALKQLRGRCWCSRRHVISNSGCTDCAVVTGLASVDDVGTQQPLPPPLLPLPATWDRHQRYRRHCCACLPARSELPADVLTQEMATLML
jgi:hypothetical protein